MAGSARGRRAWSAVCVAVVAVVVVGLGVFAGPAGPAAATSANGCVPAGRNATPNLWAQQMLAPERAWPFTRGSGQTIAILDSGVDADQPQLTGLVAAGYNAVTGFGPANTDCAGTGTQVAGAIAAEPTSSTGIYGVAPNVTIFPVRVTGQPGHDDSGGISPQVLARGINWAVAKGVTVMDVSVSLTVDDPAVRQATAAAVHAGITVVAAAGDFGSPDDGDPTTYPASYPGVIAVGAVDASGQHWPDSEHGGYIDLVAPGAGVPALQRRQGLTAVDGSTAVAAGFVSGTAALVRVRWPSLQGSQIADRLEATATPAGGGADDPDYGAGIVNPYAAVTAGMVNKAPVPMPGFTPTTPSRAQLAAAAARSRSRRMAIDLTVAGLGVLLIVTLAAIGLPRARRRAWRPVYAAPLRERVEMEEPPPPSLLFEEPSSSGSTR